MAYIEAHHLPYATDSSNFSPEYLRNRIRLEPANSTMEPIYVASARVLGVVTGVVRLRQCALPTA